MSVFMRHRVAAVSALAFLSLVSSAGAAGPTAPGVASGVVPTTAVPAPMIMIVDTNSVIERSKVFKSVQVQLDAARQSIQKDTQKREEEVQASNLELQKQQSSLAPDVLNEKARALQKRVADSRREFEIRGKVFDQGSGEAIDKIKQAVLDIITQLAEERKANLVVTKGALILSDPAYETTDEVLKRLDQKITTLTVNFPKVPLDAGADAPAVPIKKAADPAAATPAQPKKK